MVSTQSSIPTSRISTDSRGEAGEVPRGEYKNRLRNQIYFTFLAFNRMGKDPRERVIKILESLKNKRKRFSERELEGLEKFIRRGKMPIDFGYKDRRRIDWILQFLEKGEPEEKELETKYQEYIDKYNNAEYGYYQAEEEMEKNMIIRDLISLILQS